MESKSFACRCCRYLTISDQWDICPICGWEHDEIQESDPDDDGDANKVSLRQAQQNYVAFGACDERARQGYMCRRPTDADVRDANWKVM